MVTQVAANSGDRVSSHPATCPFISRISALGATKFRIRHVRQERLSKLSAGGSDGWEGESARGRRKNPSRSAWYPYIQTDAHTYAVHTRPVPRPPPNPDWKRSKLHLRSHPSLQTIVPSFPDWIELWKEYLRKNGDREDGKKQYGDDDQIYARWQRAERSGQRQNQRTTE